MASSTAALRASTTFRGKRVSRAHRVLLEAAAAAGVAFELDSGQRTKADQLELVREKGVYNAVTNPHGAARYSPSAPHVKAGHAHHALDINSIDAGQKRVARFYAAHGVSVAFNVFTEAWHMDTTDEQSLLAAARRLEDPFAGYPADERRWLHEFDHIAGHPTNVRREHVLRRVMSARRKQIWRAAQDSGWNKLERAARYRSLLARTGGLA